MSNTYYVNTKAQANGDHEVHRSDCTWLPGTENRKYLGFFSTCKEAIEVARMHYYQVNGCKTCSNTCHTQ